MPDRTTDILLIGGGVASAAAAHELRARGFAGGITLVGRELDPPYHRPPLTKEYLRGEQGREQAHAHEEAWYEAGDIELLTRTSVTRLDTAGRVATLSTKDTVGYTSVLIATGAMVRRLQVEGSELDGLHYLRAFGNADAIRADLDGAKDVVCVGGSYIGCEVAASLTALGHRVTVLMQEDEPLERGFGTQAGAWFRRVLEGHGVQVVGADEVARFAGDGRVTHVVTAAGRQLPAQLVVLGVGVTPDVMLARSAGLELGESGGIACDARLRTSADGVWAAGDVCEYDSVIHGRRIRVEHTEHAQAQGRYVAGAMLGDEQPFAVVPYFYSDLADWASLEYVGPAQRWDEEVVRGSLDGGPFGIWYLEGGRVRGALSVDGALDLDAARELLVRGEVVTAAELP
ncbi:MAG TPA: FAD-dependent oxidoreductase [Solirubrobacteraceae bacterium]|nr:FAD-dependent oxidoreductase [Solirubrobacteraceae bacterium]